MRFLTVILFACLMNACGSEDRAATDMEDGPGKELLIFSNATHELAIYKQGEWNVVGHAGVDLETGTHDVSILENKIHWKKGVENPTLGKGGQLLSLPGVPDGNGRLEVCLTCPIQHKGVYLKGELLWKAHFKHDRK